MHTPRVRLDVAFRLRCIGKFIFVFCKHVPNVIRNGVRYVFGVDRLAPCGYLKNNTS